MELQYVCIEINSAMILLKAVDLFVIMLALYGHPLSGYIRRNLSICHYIYYLQCE